MKATQMDQLAEWLAECASTCPLRMSGTTLANLAAKLIHERIGAETPGKQAHEHELFRATMARTENVLRVRMSVEPK